MKTMQIKICYIIFHFFFVLFFKTLSPLAYNATLEVYLLFPKTSFLQVILFKIPFTEKNKTFIKRHKNR